MNRFIFKFKVVTRQYHSNSVVPKSKYSSPALEHLNYFTRMIRSGPTPTWSKPQYSFFLTFRYSQEFTSRINYSGFSGSCLNDLTRTYKEERGYGCDVHLQIIWIDETLRA